LLELRPLATPLASLGEKLVKGIREYAKEAASFQGLCSQLQLGKGVLWREFQCEDACLPVSTDQCRSLLHALLPQGGHWYEAERSASSSIWIHPREALEQPHVPFGRKAPVEAYLEVSPQDFRGPTVWDNVLAEVDGVKRIFEITAVTEQGVANLRRRVTLGTDWREVNTPEGATYYWNRTTDATQWKFPNLPTNWEAYLDEDTQDYYYHNRVTRETTWNVPEFEELERELNDLEVVHDGSTHPQRSGHARVIIWRRSFSESGASLQAMTEALASARIEAASVRYT